MKRRTILLCTVVIVGLSVISVQYMTASVALGDGECSGTRVIATFSIVESEQPQSNTVSVEHRGGDNIKANKTFVVINNQSHLWSERHSPRSDGTITAGDNVSVELSRGDALRIEYQRPPPSGTLNPFEEPCYTERNQTVYSATYTPETPTRGS